MTFIKKHIDAKWAIALLLILVLAYPAKTFAAGAGPDIPRQEWTFNGIFGYYDKAQLQRGYKVYKEVCASCHAMKFLHYRNLSEPGGPEFSEEAVKAIAAEVEVEDGPNDDGEMFTRPGKPSDRFVSPFRNEQEARVANGGAYPYDLSVMAKARNAAHSTPWYLEPAKWGWDVIIGYEEAGADYLYALLTGYVDPPEKKKNAEGEMVPFELGEGMNYNKYYPGHQIAMVAPLSEEIVEYTDGTPQTVEQYSKDVTAFLMWAAEPKLEERKKMGFWIFLYLVVLSLLLYLAKNKIWSKLKH